MLRDCQEGVAVRETWPAAWRISPAAAGCISARRDLEFPGHGGLLIRRPNAGRDAAASAIGFRPDELNLKAAGRGIVHPEFRRPPWNRFTSGYRAFRGAWTGIGACRQRRGTSGRENPGETLAGAAFTIERPGQSPRPRTRAGSSSARGISCPAARRSSNKRNAAGFRHFSRDSRRGGGMVCAQARGIAITPCIARLCRQ